MALSVLIDLLKDEGENTRFWAAAGLDSLYPLCLSESGAYLMERMRKFGTCRYLRNHHALSEITRETLRAGGEAYSEDEHGNPIYSFERMNGIYEKYLEYGIKPVVEMDYLPKALIRESDAVGGVEEGRHNGRSWPNDWGKWRNLLVAFTQNLVARFGIEEVRTWYFEVWNEPDSWAVDDWPQFYRMYDIFVAAVTGVDGSLQVGGPGTYTLPFLKGFLNHVVNGTNAETGEKGTRIDFISHHIYGMSGGWINEYPLAMPTVQRFVHELLWIGRSIGAYPSLINVPFHLNEWGVCSHYEKSSLDHTALSIRDSEFSALFFIKLVDCIFKLREKFGFEVSMLLYWGFCAEDHFGQIFHGHRSLTTAHRLPKPIQTAHELLSLMGDRLAAVSGLNSGGPVGILAAKNGGGAQVLAYHFSEYDEEAMSAPRSGTAEIRGLKDGVYNVQVYLMDREHHNTYRLWQAMGGRREPDAVDMAALRKAAELTPNREYQIVVEGGVHKLPLHLQAQSAHLYMLTKGDQPK
ncbi:MAG: GH39 family glycosyl hydrolase [Christensenellales bacterium]|jgi:xylan 1,4-beta-xylosidase